MFCLQFTVYSLQLISLHAQTNGIQFWGTSFVAGPQGEIIYEASVDEEESIIVGLDLSHSEQVRRWWPFLRDRRIDAYDGILRRFID